jgi:ferredoxin
MRAGRLYHAIDMRPIQLPVDREELESQGFTDFEIDEMSTILAPFVNADNCVGCGICTYRCHTRYVVQEQRLDAAAIPVVAENEDRIGVNQATSMKTSTTAREAES